MFPSLRVAIKDKVNTPVVHVSIHWEVVNKDSVHRSQGGWNFWTTVESFCKNSKCSCAYRLGTSSPVTRTQKFSVKLKSTLPRKTGEKRRNSVNCIPVISVLIFGVHLSSFPLSVGLESWLVLLPRSYHDARERIPKHLRVENSLSQS